MSFLLLLNVFPVEDIELTEAKIDALTAGIHLAITLWIFFMPESLHIFASFLPVQALLRVMLGLVLLDWKKTAVLNSVSALAIMTKLYIMSQSVLLDQWQFLASSEAFVFAFSTTVCHAYGFFVSGLAMTIASHNWKFDLHDLTRAEDREWLSDNSFYASAGSEPRCTAHMPD